MSDTPRTDAETWRGEMDHVDTDYTFAQSATVSADFARQLERELTAARAEITEWRILNGWGGTPEIINDFIKGQQTRIHHAQNLEEELDRVTEQRDRMKALAGELIAMIRINVIKGHFEKCTIEQIDEHLKPWIEKIAAAKIENQP